MTLKLEQLSTADAADILAFEKQNKAYFSQFVLPRPDSYFQMDTLKNCLAEWVEDQKNDSCYMYLLRDHQNQLVGRVNVVSVTRGPFQKAEVGYRIGEKFTGKGYAKIGLSLAVEQAFTVLGLHKLEAGTGVSNRASQCVLESNGFRLVGEQKDVIYLKDKWENGFLYEKISSSV